MSGVDSEFGIEAIIIYTYKIKKIKKGVRVCEGGNDPKN